MVKLFCWSTSDQSDPLVVVYPPVVCEVLLHGGGAVGVQVVMLGTAVVAAGALVTINVIPV